MYLVIASTQHTYTYKPCDVRANELKIVFKQNAHDSHLICCVRTRASQRPWYAFRVSETKVKLLLEQISPVKILIHERARMWMVCAEYMAADFLGN